MPRINNIPLGYLSFLESKNFGKNPPDATDQVNPIIDIGDFYAAGQLERVVGPTTAITVVGTPTAGAGLVVPQTETWVVYGLTFATVPLAAGQSVRIRAAVLNASGSRLWVSPSAGTATAGEIATSSYIGRFVVPPGSIFGFTCEQLAAGPINSEVFAAVVRLLI